MSHRIFSLHRHPLARAVLILATAAPGWAQNKAPEPPLDVRTPEAASRQAGKPVGDPAPADAAVPQTLPARRDTSAPRRLDTMIDPFEVSPQLRDGRRAPGSFGGLPVASKLDVQRQIQIKALLVTPRGRGAQLLVRGQQTILVKDGDLIDFGDLGTFMIHVGTDDGVTLTNPGLPQGNKITLR